MLVHMPFDAGYNHSLKFLFAGFDKKFRKNISNYRVENTTFRY
jgi:hypothetical protein